MALASEAGALVIVGASVRAMAASAVRAGFRVFAADLFGDHDLRTVAREVQTIRPYPDGLRAAIAGFPRAPVIYTGALENHPGLIAALAADRPLAGSTPTAVRHVRDPDALPLAVRNAGLLYPDTRQRSTGLPVDGTWLTKPLASAGGRGIRSWLGVAESGSLSLWQKRIAGWRLSVGFAIGASQCQLITATRQLVGSRWCRASPFAYCGSINLDPASFTTGLRHQLVQLGDLLAEHFCLAGLVGADLIVDDVQRAWVIEINPRPTASMELAERSKGLSLANHHLAAFGISSPITTEPRSRPGTWAKAVLFARDDIDFVATSLDTLLTRAASWTCDDGWPAVADLPEPPCLIPAGAPVCTAFAHGASPRAALVLLRKRVAEIENAMLA